MLWIVIASLGDVPTAIIACAGLALGVLIMARGARGGAREAAAAAPSAPAAAPTAVMLAPAVAEDPAEAATTFRQGTIKLADEAEPDAEPEPEPEPAAAAETPNPAPLPEFPRTDFRQGTIRLGSIDRGRRDP